MASLLTPVGEASAADPPATITTVTIEGEHPNRAFPLDQPFYVEGSAKDDVTRVDLVFVRYWSRPFGAAPLRLKHSENDIRSCDDVARFATPKAYDAEGEKPGTFRFREIWNVPNGTDLQQLEREQRVLLVSPWKRDPDTKSPDKFKILVDQAEWFLPGARYCAFVYEYDRDGQVDSKVANAVQKFATDMDALAVPGKDLGADVEAAIASFLQKTFCVSEGADVNCTPNDPRIPVTETKWQDIATKFKARGHNAAFTIARRRGELRDLSTCWNKQTRMGAIRGSLPATSPEARLALELAALAGYVSRTTPTAYQTNDGDFQIAEVEIVRYSKTGRLKDLRLYPADRSKQQILGIGLDQLVVRGSKTTLEDVFLFLEGSAVHEGQAKAIAELLGQLGSRGKPRPSDLSSLASIRSTFETLLAEPKDGLSATDPRVLIAQLKPNNPLIRWGVDRLSDVCAADTIPPEHQERPPKPLNKFLDELVADYDRESPQWMGFERDAAESLEVTSQRAVPLVREGYTQERYVSDYVTPVQGFAGVVADDGNAPFFLPYTGVQVYFAANPVDRPMWSRGYRDLVRLASLELGIAERTQAMGPQGRFRGFSGGRFPPVMLGVGLQVAPWLTLSNGVTFLERRRSEFGGERYDVVVRYFFAGTVQLNVPGIIRRLSGSKRSTDATP